jgi:hypothetical protein
MTEPIKQPEPLRLADALEQAIQQTDAEDNVIHVARWFVQDAAAELRRLHGEVAAITQRADEIHKWYDVALERAENAEAEVERLLNNERVLTDAVWKACGDDESVVHDTITSQGGLK